MQSTTKARYWDEEELGKVHGLKTTSISLTTVAQLTREAPAHSKTCIHQSSAANWLYVRCFGVLFQNSRATPGGLWAFSISPTSFKVKIISYRSSMTSVYIRYGLSAASASSAIPPRELLSVPCYSRELLGLFWFLLSCTRVRVLWLQLGLFCNSDAAWSSCPQDGKLMVLHDWITLALPWLVPFWSHIRTVSIPADL